ncbi:MAG: hypothetical protein GY757_26040 [bacterium]|nr:hypothetical protein [bacterium]
MKHAAPWPDLNLFQNHRKHLESSLKKYIPWDDGAACTANALVKLEHFKGQKLVILAHDIFSSEWNKHTGSLIKWYINDFWEKLEPDGQNDIPLFLVFFCIKYKKPDDKGIKHSISRSGCSLKRNLIKISLAKIQQPAHEKCPCLLLDEFPTIKDTDVSRWFDMYDPYKECDRKEVRRKNAIKAIFKSGKPTDMTEIENELLQIIEGAGEERQQ